jgi:hypothetical protein
MTPRNHYLPPECEEICVSAELNIMSPITASIESADIDNADTNW